MDLTFLMKIYMYLYCIIRIVMYYIHVFVFSFFALNYIRNIIFPIYLYVILYPNALKRYLQFCISFITSAAFILFSHIAIYR